MAAQYLANVRRDKIINERIRAIVDYLGKHEGLDIPYNFHDGTTFDDAYGTSITHHPVFIYHMDDVHLIFLSHYHNDDEHFVLSKIPGQTICTFTVTGDEHSVHPQEPTSKIKERILTDTPTRQTWLGETKITYLDTTPLFSAWEINTGRCTDIPVYRDHQRPG